MQDSSSKYLRITLSPERFESYRPSEGASDERILACYLWNVQLSEALYPILSILEVALRNKLHNALIKTMGSEQWYDIEPSILTPAEQSEVKRVKEYLRQRKKTPEPGRIVAELNFGFWTSLFHSSYERVLWPELIPEVFPYAPRWTRERKKLSKRLNRFRHLRNRVFHYEPIWDWENLPQLHQDMLDTIGWMCPATQTVSLKMDRFPEVYRIGKPD